MPTLCVMSFNIRGAYRDDGINIWENRAALNVATIKRCAPDLIGFQELQLGNLATYREQLSEYSYLSGPHIGEQEPYEYIAIFWKPSRLRLLDSGGFWLNETPDQPVLGWDAACMRAAHWAKFQVIDSLVQLLHLNTHLDHVSERARQEGSKLIFQRLQQLQNEHTPVIVTGDFNCDPNTPTYNLWQASNFVDTYLATGNIDLDGERSNSFHAFGWSKPSSSGAQRSGSMRIDWILLRDTEGQLRPVSCEIVRDAQPPLYPSDHYPVVTTFGVGSA